MVGFFRGPGWVADGGGNHVAINDRMRKFVLVPEVERLRAIGGYVKYALDEAPVTYPGVTISQL